MQARNNFKSKQEVLAKYVGLAAAPVPFDGPLQQAERVLVRARTTKLEILACRTIVKDTLQGKPDKIVTLIKDQSSAFVKDLALWGIAPPLLKEVLWHALFVHLTTGLGIALADPTQ